MQSMQSESTASKSYELNPGNAPPPSPSNGASLILVLHAFSAHGHQRHHAAPNKNGHFASDAGSGGGDHHNGCPRHQGPAVEGRTRSPQGAVLWGRGGVGAFVCSCAGGRGGCQSSPSRPPRTHNWTTPSRTLLQPGPGAGGWHKASVSDCLPLATPIGLSPLLILTLRGPERVLVV